MLALQCEPYLLRHFLKVALQCFQGLPRSGHRHCLRGVGARVQTVMLRPVAFGRVRSCSGETGTSISAEARWSILMYVAYPHGCNKFVVEVSVCFEHVLNGTGALLKGERSRLLLAIQSSGRCWDSDSIEIPAVSHGPVSF